MDEQIDKQGAIRDSRYRYIRNYIPEKSDYMPVKYRNQMPMMKRMVQLYEMDSLNYVQKLWFNAPRPAEEFYDVSKDPYEVNNLIEIPAYKAIVNRMRRDYEKWDKTYNNLWRYSEKECREMFWPGGIQPQVYSPIIAKKGKYIYIYEVTPGASVAYQINGKGYDKNSWFLYSQPINVKYGDLLQIIAVKAGCKNSEVVKYKV
jgi:hypothetical protein